jgi:Na+/melibiose symporter-like transporter
MDIHDVPDLSKKTMAQYSVASIGAGFFYAFNNAVLPLLIPSNNVLLVNLMSNTRSIEGTVIQPVVGAWSDRIWTRLGRRRPFMLVAMPLSALFMALTPLAPSLAGIVACIVAFSLLFNVAADPYTALMADIARPEQRPTLNAVALVVQFVGQVGLTLVLAFGPFGKHLPALAYPLVAGGILITTLITVATVPERREWAHIEPRRRLDEYVAGLRSHRQAMRYLVALFFYNTGINTIQVNLTRFARSVLHVSDSDALKLFLIVILFTGLLTVPAARLAERVGVKPVIIAGMLLIAVAASSAFVVTTVAQVIPVLIVAGIGNACLSLAWPLLTLLVPPERIGVFAGLKTSAESLSAFFSSFVAAAMVDAWGYRSIFTVLLVAIVASLVTLLPIRVTALPEPVVSSVLS